MVLAEQGESGVRVLMFNDRDPGIPGSSWWVLTPRDAARRELAEESGHVVEDDDLYGPVARRVALHGYSDQVTEQWEEIFVVWAAETFEVDVSGHTEFERVSVQGHAWRTVDDGSAAVIWPADLARLVAITQEPEAWP